MYIATMCIKRQKRQKRKRSKFFKIAMCTAPLYIVYIKQMYIFQNLILYLIQKL